MNENELNEIINKYIYDKYVNLSENEKQNLLIYNEYLSKLEYDKHIESVVNKYISLFNQYKHPNKTFNQYKYLITDNIIPDDFYLKKYYYWDNIIFNSDENNFHNILVRFSEVFKSYNTNKTTYTLDIMNDRYFFLKARLKEIKELKGENEFIEKLIKIILNYGYELSFDNTDVHFFYKKIILEEFYEFNRKKNENRFFKKDYVELLIDNYNVIIYHMKPLERIRDKVIPIIHRIKK